MKKNDIKRPKILEISNSEVNIETFIRHDIYEMESNELADILMVPLLFTKATDIIEGTPAVFFNPASLNNDFWEMSRAVLNRVGKLIRLGEFINGDLSETIKKYLLKYSINEISNRNSDCKKCLIYDVDNNFHKLTFGNLKNILSCIIKTNADLHVIEKLNTKEKRNNFTAIFTNYIYDRDRYVHGHLFFHYDGKMLPILKVKSQEFLIEFISFEYEVFKDNLLTYNFLNSILNKVQSVLNDK